MKKISKLMALALTLSVGAQLAACGNSKDNIAPTYNYSEGLDENGFFEGIKASELVTLPEYKGVDIDKEIPVASDAEIQEQIDDVLSNYSYYEQIIDREIVDGDTVNIDYVGYIGDVQFNGGNTGGIGTAVTIGTSNYVEGFLKQLIGHRAGDEFDITVTFPEDYGREELNGKEAVFKTKINYIQGEYIAPALTDEIAVEYGFETADELVANIEDGIVSSAKFYFFTDLLAEADCEEVPESVIDYVKSYDLSQYEYYASMSGMTVEEFLVNYMGYESLDAYVTANSENYRSSAVHYLAAQAIAELEGITVTDKQIEDAGYGEYVSEYGKPYIKQFMLSREILPQFVIDNGNLVEMSQNTEAE